MEGAEKYVYHLAINVICLKNRIKDKDLKEPLKELVSSVPEDIY